MNIFQKFFNYFKTYYTIYWGVLPYLKVKDKSTFQEDKKIEFDLKQSLDTMFYSCPISFGKLRHIWRVSSDGSQKEDVIASWEFKKVKDYYTYSFTIKVDEPMIANYIFSFSKIDGK